MRNARSAEIPPPLELAFVCMTTGLPLDGSREEPAESADTVRALADQLRRRDPGKWPADLVADYLQAVLVTRGRVHVYRGVERTERDPYLLNERVMYGRETAFRHLLACEACGAIFQARNRRNLDESLVRCEECAYEERAGRVAHRRRSARAWWQDVGPAAGLEVCIGCSVFPDRNPRASASQVALPRCVPAFVEAGSLYCSDRCRKRVARYVDSGGTIEFERGGVYQRLGA